MRSRPLQRDLFGNRAPLAVAPARTVPIEVAPLQRWKRALRRRGWFLAAVVAAAAASGWAASRAMQPSYRSTASVEAQTPVPAVRFAPAPPSAVLGNDAATELQTMAEELGSRRLVAQVAQRLGPGLDAGFWRWPAPRPPAPEALATAAMRRLQIETVPQSRLIRLSFTAPNAALAAKFLRDLVAAYVAEAQSRQRAAGLERLDVVETQAAAAQARVAAAQATVVGFAERHELADPARQMVMSSQRWQQIAAAETSAELSAARPVDDLPGTTTGTAPTPLELELKRTDLVAAVGRLAAQYQPGAAPLQQARQQLAAVDAALADYHRENLQAARQWLAAERRQASDLAQALQAQTRKQTALQATLAELDLDQRQLAADQDVYSDLLQQQQRAAAEANTATPPLRVVDPALPPSRPASPDLGTALAYATLLGCGLGFAAVALLEFADDGVRMPEAAELGVPLLAMLAPDDAAEPRRLSAGLASCVASLLLAQAEAGVRVVQVTSAEPGSGTTTVAIEVARLLAQVAASVLVLDGDPQNVALARRAGGPPRPGLMELLAGRITVEQALQRWPGEKAPWYIAGGAAPIFDAEAKASFAVWLASPAMADLIAAARLRYDWIVVDSGPIFVGPEAGIWASLADCSLCVAARGRTSRSRLRRGLDILEASGAAHVGLILNRAPEGRRGSLPAAWLARPPQSEPGVAAMRQRA